MWWSSGNLDPRTHTLSITAEDVQEGDLIWIDFLQIIAIRTFQHASGICLSALSIGVDIRLRVDDLNTSSGGIVLARIRFVKLVIRWLILYNNNSSRLQHARCSIRLHYNKAITDTFKLSCAS
ncbi:hypothetical protein PsYK624_148460 [Phanerochaete sordida]|uniref:Uncharacterized protein n=1 Tax=Phanerochaete sordida TaxID=48140 RepID=A0A9P3GNA4_9APHY|nr:hypothetical protein PsYK624_148460 [Phanerochaete sordida]